MRKIRLAVTAAALACGLLLLGGVGAAGAATPTKFAKKVPVTGTAKGGKKFTGTFTIDRFASRSGKMYAIGTLKGKLKNRSVTRRNVAMPATMSQGAQSAQIPTPTPGACPVLTLTLGPLNLNLLGLRVATNDIHLLVEAIPSTLPGGGLLGDLLCGVSNLLNPTAGTPLGTVTRLLNALLALLGG